MPGVFGNVVAEGDRFRRLPRVEDEAAPVGGEDSTSKERKPWHGEGVRPAGTTVGQVIGLGVERGEEGGRTGVVLGRQPHLLDSRPQLDDRGSKGEQEEGTVARGSRQVGGECRWSRLRAVLRCSSRLGGSKERPWPSTPRRWSGQSRTPLRATDGKKCQRKGATGRPQPPAGDMLGCCLWRRRCGAGRGGM